MLHPLSPTPTGIYDDRSSVPYPNILPPWSRSGSCNCMPRHHDTVLWLNLARDTNVSGTALNIWILKSPFTPTYEKLSGSGFNSLNRIRIKQCMLCVPLFCYVSFFQWMRAESKRLGLTGPLLNGFYGNPFTTLSGTRALTEFHIFCRVCRSLYKPHWFWLAGFESGARRAKMTHQKRRNKEFHVL